MNLPLISILVLAGAPRAPETPIVCDNCAAWNRPREPFKVVGNTYYVGVEGLSAVVIDTGKGLILLDGALPQSALLIEANLKTLGFRIRDVRLIVNSHAHDDHAGGIALLQRDSGAEVAASPSGAEALRLGCPTADDPQVGDCNKIGYGAVAKVKVVKDGEAVMVGDFGITPHFTPGHTPGSTTWTWKSCEGSTCYDVVYADSLNATSNEGFRFSGDATHPDISKSFAQSIDKVASLPCDVLLSVHPELSGTFGKQAKARTGQKGPFVESGACRIYAESARKRLQDRLEKEKSADLDHHR